VGEHAKLSPSGAARWMSCTASASVEALLPDESSVYADEGSRMHNICEKLLRIGADATSELSHFYNDFKPVLGSPETTHFTDDVDTCADYAQQYLNYCRAQPGMSFIERKVDYSEYAEGGFGTADYITVGGDTLWVTDLKYGAGVRVHAKENPQAMMYALGAYLELNMLYEIKTVKIAIVQPRMDSISEWSLSVEDLLEWAETVREKAAEALSDSPVFAPGNKTCKWCKAKLTCAARAKWATDIATEGFDEIEEVYTARTDGKLLSPDDIAAIYASLKGIESWIKDVRSHAYKLAMNGEPPKGLKLVSTLKNSAWIDADKAEKAVLKVIKPEDAYTKKFLSPTQAKKLLPKGDTSFDHLIERPSGNPALVTVDDDRPELIIDPSEGFSAVENT